MSVVCDTGAKRKKTQNKHIAIHLSSSCIYSVVHTGLAPVICIRALPSLSFACSYRPCPCWHVCRWHVHTGFASVVWIFPFVHTGLAPVDRHLHTGLALVDRNLHTGPAPVVVPMAIECFARSAKPGQCENKHEPTYIAIGICIRVLPL